LWYESRRQYNTIQYNTIQFKKAATNVHVENRSVNVTVVSTKLIIMHKHKKRMLNVIKEIPKTFEMKTI